jgi:YNFM family putative membrane transporter
LDTLFPSAHFTGMTDSTTLDPAFARQPARLIDASDGMARGSRDYRNASIALFLAGFSTFSLLYCVQPLLPEFARDFAINAAASSMALSVTTGALALAIFVAGALSHSVERRGLMLASMLLSAMCNLAAALSPSWTMLLTARLLAGLALGGVPAVAMAYLAEEIRPSDLGKAVGLYVAGTAFGGMAGRVGMGALTEFTTWRMALSAMSVLGLASAAGFALLLPSSRRFVARRGATLVDHVRIWSEHLANPVLRRLFAIGFLLTSVYVAAFNYIAFRLVAAPYGFGLAALSGIYLVTLFGVAASTLSGAAADRFGRYGPLLAGLLLIAGGIATTLATPIAWVIVGVAAVNAGFFVAHTVVSGWVGQESGSHKGHGASLYLLFYYVGSSVSGPVAGWFWHGGGWNGVAAMMAIACLLAIILTVLVNRHVQRGRKVSGAAAALGPR